MKIKICGITNLEDALMAIEYGADALGFVFSKSPRQITPEAARQLIDQLPPFVTTVGVFANETKERLFEILEICPLDRVQLHGDEDPAYCAALKDKKIIKAIRIKDASSLQGIEDYPVCAFLFDTYSKEACGGTGKTFDWNLKKPSKPLILAGGLTPENVGQAIQALRPYGVDASSLLESAPGKKDPAKVRAFIEAVRKESA